MFSQVSKCNKMPKKSLYIYKSLFYTLILQSTNVKVGNKSDCKSIFSSVHLHRTPLVCLQLSFLPLFPVEEERMNIRNIFNYHPQIAPNVEPFYLK